MPSRFLSPAYEVMLSAASPGINFLRGVAGYQDPIGTPAMQDRMLELEAQKGPSGSIGYEDYGLPVSSEGGRFTGGLPSLLLSNPIDFGLAGSVGRYGYSPEGRTGLKYDFTSDEETGSTGNAILDFINKGGIKNYISESKGLPFAQPDFINAPQDYYQPMAMRKDLGIDTSYGVANEPDDEQDQDYIDQVNQSNNKFGGIMDLLMGIAIPGYGLFKNIAKGGLEGLKGFNQKLQQSDFGQATSLMDYLDMRKYGGAQGRRDAAARTMAQARGITKSLASRPSSTSGGYQQGPGGSGAQSTGASKSQSQAGPGFSGSGSAAEMGSF
jgi:hypothetical protein